MPVRGRALGQAMPHLEPAVGVRNRRSGGIRDPAAHQQSRDPQRQGASVSPAVHRVGGSLLMAPAPTPMPMPSSFFWYCCHSQHRGCSTGGLWAEQHWEGSAKASGEGSPHQSPPWSDPQEGANPPASPTAPCSPTGERVRPQGGCRAELVALTFEWPSRRSLWKTWQNFQQSTALPDSGSRFTTDQKVCAPFSWCVPRMHGGGPSRKRSLVVRDSGHPDASWYP